MKKSKIVLPILVLIGVSAAFWTGCSDDGDICDDKEGWVTCGYCNEDRARTRNPHAGMCRYCAAGTTCSGDICGDLKCVPVRNSIAGIQMDVADYLKLP